MESNIAKYMAFVAAAELGSFTKAAQHLNYTQPAVSRMIHDADLCSDPFILLEKGTKAEISEIFERSGLSPKTHLTTWDDYAVMSMVESGLGVSILPELILKRVPYKIAVRELDVPSYRKIGFAVRNKKTASLAVKKFIDYLKYR